MNNSAATEDNGSTVLEPSITTGPLNEVANSEFVGAGSLPADDELFVAASVATVSTAETDEAAGAEPEVLVGVTDAAGSASLPQADMANTTAAEATAAAILR